MLNMAAFFQQDTHKVMSYPFRTAKNLTPVPLKHTSKLRIHRRYQQKAVLAALDFSIKNERLEQETEFQKFKYSCKQGNMIPIVQKIFSDHLTPVIAYRSLVSKEDSHSPSFLLEGVTNGESSGRYTFVGARPCMEVLAKGNNVTIINHQTGTRQQSVEDDPLLIPKQLASNWTPVVPNEIPQQFCGGWAGYAGYDTVRYGYPNKLPFETAPVDDRQLLDMHLALYRDTIVFDGATKIVYIIGWIFTEEYNTVEEAYMSGKNKVQEMVSLLSNSNMASLPNARVDLDTSKRPVPPAISNMSKPQFLDAVETTKEYIQAGDIFQLVYSQRFERRTFADPFEIYRALRVVNPSPYMAYLQCRGCILVASSPEILCKVDSDGIITNRPLAGTRKRGQTPEEDKQLEVELLADEKECAEHVMLVDLGRNDVGRVAKDGSVCVESYMDIERYSHVMHISSTVKGKLKEGLDSWDALRAALPVGTVSGAPKVRAMQIIDELEPTRRGPYGGGLGVVSFDGGMDMALALRTMVIPTNSNDYLYQYTPNHKPRKEWVVYLQAGAGIVADSVAEKEYEETVNKAAALGRAIDLAESAFDCEST
eukprot:TRINITY_DN6745_c0_g2_i3.p1 TRINITY_DN6745_c0_g2~~TRINITY_DN6745_c0_g2_i3.p1  ORF type:complete len:611 (+),score=77.88 TRINITY_DN6745_c0_g2_i3:52-1833(+)